MVLAICVFLRLWEVCALLAAFRLDRWIKYPRPRLLCVLFELRSIAFVVGMFAALRRAALALLLANFCRRLCLTSRVWGGVVFS